MGFTEPQRKETGIWTGLYSLTTISISIQAVLNYAGTSNFAKGKEQVCFHQLVPVG